MVSTTNSEPASAHRNGKILVVSPSQDLPKHCIKCGQAMDGEYLRKKFGWHSPWIYLMIIFPGILIYLIVALFAQERIELGVPLCRSHRQQRRHLMLAGSAVMIGAIPIALLLDYAGLATGWAMLLMVGLILLGAVILALGTPLLKPTYIGDDHATFKGGAPEFLAHLPEGPIPDHPRSAAAAVAVTLFAAFILLLGLGVVLSLQEDKEQRWDQDTDHALELYQQGRYDEGIEVATNSLELATDVFGEGHPNVAYTQNLLALNYEASGDYDRAEGLYKQAITILGNGSDDESLSTYHGNLGDLYMTQERYTEAEEHLKRYVELRKQLHGDKHGDVADAMFSLGELYHTQERYEEAERVYRPAVEVGTKTFESWSPWGIEQIDKYAEALEKLGQSAEAADMKQLAQELREKTKSE